MNIADLKGKPVVSMADGTKIGEIADIAIDTSAWTVRDLLVSAKTGQSLLPIVNVKSVGPDAATVESESATSWSAKTPALPFDHFKKLHVVDGSGTAVGNVSDLVYDMSGRIESFEVRQGGVFGIGASVRTVVPAEILGVGDKLITVELTPVDSIGDAMSSSDAA